MRRMRTSVKRWGNSAAVRIPASVMEAADIHLEDVVDISEKEGEIILKPVRSKGFDLDDLVDGINPGNLHEPIDFGPPQGKELSNTEGRTPSGRRRTPNAERQR
jgi:antitoxin MazE